MVNIEFGTDNTNAVIITNKAQLNSAIVYNDQNNNFGAFYEDLASLGATPSNPAVGSIRFYVRAVDANNDGLFVLLKKSGGFVEMQIA